MYLDHVVAYLLALPSLVNYRRRSLLPTMRERCQVADALARHLGQLELERKPKDLMPTLDLIRKQFARHANGEGPTDDGR